MTEAKRIVIVNNDGLLVDHATGIVVDDLPFDYGPEWRAYDEHERMLRSRIGAPLTELVHDNGLHTYIVYYEALRKGYARLARTHYKVTKGKYASKKMIGLLQHLGRICSEEDLPTRICEDSAWALKVIKKRVPNAGNENAVRAALMYALGVHGHPLFYKYNSPSLQRLLRRAGILFKLNEEALVDSYVRHLIAELELPTIVELYAMKIYNVFIRGVGNPSPRVRAAAATYVAAKLADADATMDRLSKSLEITDMAMRTLLKKTRLRVLYLVDGGLVDEWHPGKDSHGIRQPKEIASRYGITSYSYIVNIPTSNKEPIAVIIYER
ncbi:transcription initiation factor IIB family protein [Pyrofollis japonicus]|uniref:hypothetical protein n=1 Tax=Pyrofollis japonicus TaxID=3060460 RepID=UPI00295A9614|nr:hypothetical protein [Pyrofollis japonicus]BEP17049.1 transcription initiation factor IIB family protein [Pyrofollis japonicus]